MDSYVKLHIENSIGTIEFFHPQSNSLPSNILNKIADTIKQVSINDDIKVVILKSGGDRVFCAGASFDELLAIKDSKSGKEFFSGFANVINAARKCPKFIIGRVQGKAVGGGVGIISATDYCFATKFAAVKLSELDLGIGPFVIGPAVEHKIGKSAFSSMAINARKWFDPILMKEKGLYAEVFESTQEMDESVKNISLILSKYNPEAMQELKKIIWENTSEWDHLLSERAKMSGKLVLSKFTKDAISNIKK